ncbi:MAG TPA: chlorophyll synthesis pathway protein BchC [Longimicrobium sp.]|nr:chlorophyll synthesis pathway protein BchC [Longimicrobium sp.]
MDTVAVVLDQPEQLALRTLALDAAGEADVVVRTEWSGISTGTERLLFTGTMPPFPGMGYPLVPGYETVGTVIDAGAASGRRIGERVFVPGARCFGATRGLFGGAASVLVAPGARTVSVEPALEEGAVLLALAATAHHACWGSGGAAPELIVGHGALGRLLARIAVALGHAPPVVWETNPMRREGAEGYAVVDPADDPRRDYRSVVDCSGAAGLLDELVGRTAKGGEIVLAGFYDVVSFRFVPAFLRETRIRVAAEFAPADLDAVTRMAGEGRLSLDNIVTHRARPADAGAAYRTAFGDPACVKMILDWREAA